MKSVSGREFARIIERRGWTLLRISGSHHIYGNSGSIVRLSIPIHWLIAPFGKTCRTDG
jgi:predicted RNA binding protein YcfA (HicA-like mRNA interferase family)